MAHWAETGNLFAGMQGRQCHLGKRVPVSDPERSLQGHQSAEAMANSIVLIRLPFLEILKLQEVTEKL